MVENELATLNTVSAAGGGNGNPCDDGNANRNANTRP